MFIGIHTSHTHELTLAHNTKNAALLSSYTSIKGLHKLTMPR